MRIPISQSIQAFKERTVALNLLNVGTDQKKVSSKRFGPRASINEVMIHVRQCRGLIAPISNSPSVYCAFQFYQYDDLMTETVRGSTSPLFNFLKMLPVPMTSDLDRYLRTSEVFSHLIPFR
jgi:hypothetical protein